MDSPLISRLFRQFFSHRTCQPMQNGQAIQRRSLSSTGSRYKLDEADWQQRTDAWPVDMMKAFHTYPMVTAYQLRGRRERPRRVKMLARDFIEDSLYNPSYGYFSNQVVIFTPGEPFDFNNMKNEPEFHKQLGQRYTDFEDELDAKQANDARQLWHTPTELFKPYYGEALARYLVANYKLSQYPYHDLIIYEMGAGNGTLMLNILDYIRDIEPSVYDRTKYKIIEISCNLARLQQQQLLRTAGSRGHARKVEIINKSIFEWNQIIPAPCYFLAMEVFDNFAHDSIRYDPVTEEPHQGSVLIDDKGEFYEFYSKTIDPVASRFLRVRHAATGGRYRKPLNENMIAKKILRGVWPLSPNLSDPEYIPTRLMQFFDILGEYFPSHRLMTSDFHALPDTVKGINAPVVQTRYRRRTVPVTTPYVHQGYFDILFPTDFNVMKLMYMAITGKLTRVSTHEEFLRMWAYVEETETKSGENPLLSWYRNASVLTTV